MKRWRVAHTVSTILALLSLVSSGVPGFAREDKEKAEANAAKQDTVTSYTGPKKRLAVMDLEVKISANSVTEPTATGGITTTTTVNLPPPNDFGNGLTEMLTTALVKTNRFIVLERKALQDIAAEQQLGVGNAVRPDSAAPIGNFLGAQVLIRGAITEFAYSKSSVGAGGVLKNMLGVSRNSITAMVALDVRLYDVATGQVIDSVRAEGKGKSTGMAVDYNKGDIKIGGAGFETTPLGQVSRQAIDQAVAFIIARMERMPWEGRIAEMDGGDENTPPEVLYINAGSSLGLKEGDELEILRSGRPITDPETKVVIGRTKDLHLGKCRIESLTNTLARAVPLEGKGFQKGDLVRLQEKPQQE